MDLSSMEALVRDIDFDTLGIPVTVTPLGGSSITTQGIWSPSIFDEPPVGKDYNRREPRRVMALRIDEVPDIPRGSLIVASEFDGEDAKNWKVDGVEKTDRDHIRVILVDEHS